MANRQDVCKQTHYEFQEVPMRFTLAAALSLQDLIVHIWTSDSSREIISLLGAPKSCFTADACIADPSKDVHRGLWNELIFAELNVIRTLMVFIGQTGPESCVKRT